jgi:hypothetical protein
LASPGILCWGFSFSEAQKSEKAFQEAVDFLRRFLCPVRGTPSVLTFSATSCISSNSTAISRSSLGGGLAAVDRPASFELLRGR